MSVARATGSRLRNVPPVSGYATLPASGNTDGDTRVTLDTLAEYVWSATDSIWVPQTLQNLAVATQNYEDFESDVLTAPRMGLQWTTSVTGTAAAVNVVNANVDSTHFGLRELNSGTTATGRASLYASIQQRAISLVGGARVYVETMVRVPTLGAGSQRYEFRWGLGNFWNTSTQSPVNSYYFEYHSNTSANWRCVNQNGAAVTAVDSGTAVAANTWYKLGMLYSAAGTPGVTYLINGSTVPSTPITTNLPTGIVLGWGFRILKTQGTTARNIIIDYFLQRSRLHSSR